MKKNGFISTTLIYGFFLIFLSLMTFLIINISNENNLLKEYKKRIKEDFLETTLDDPRINIYLINNNNEKLKINYIPTKNYVILKETCNQGKIYFNEQTNKFRINANSSAKCEVDFQIFDNVILNLYYNDILTVRIPTDNFTYDCKNKDVNTSVKYVDSHFEIVSDSSNDCSLFYTNDVIGEKNE